MPGWSRLPANSATCLPPTNDRAYLEPKLSNPAKEGRFAMRSRTQVRPDRCTCYNGTRTCYINGLGRVANGTVFLFLPHGPRIIVIQTYSTQTCSKRANNRHATSVLSHSHQQQHMPKVEETTRSKKTFWIVLDETCHNCQCCSAKRAARRLVSFVPG